MARHSWSFLLFALLSGLNGCGSAGPSAASQGTGASSGSGGQENMMSANGGNLTGGASSAGGSSGGASSGGAPTTSGGAVSGGGPATTGGTSSSGSAPATGGDANSGGSPAGGAAGSGGAPLGSGGTGGSSGAGGGPTETVCGTAPEDGSATLHCPTGMVIDQVTFASYGTPTGTCGAFSASNCDAATSESVVLARCQGRTSCTVSASNSNFGDPCSAVTKKLAVEVSCIPGEPIADPDGPLKGVANSPHAELAELGARWCYNWGTTPQATDCDDPLFVPMIWGDGDVASALSTIKQAGYTTVLGFNEPNKSDQANMSVARAIELWPTLTSDPSIRVSSPAVSDDGRAWLEDFMDQAQQKGLRVDFIAMHWYGWNADSCKVSQLSGALNWASQWGLPVWITEFGCMGSSNPDEQTVLTFFNDAAAMLNQQPQVERYAWYPWNTYNHLFESGTITNLGKAFQAAP